jgi:hypothetical protein
MALREQVAVGVDGRCDRLMSQLLLNVWKRNLPGDEPGHVRVPKVMRRRPLREPGGLGSGDRLAPALVVKVGLVDWPSPRPSQAAAARRACRRGEDEIVGLLALDAALQDPRHAGGDVNGGAWTSPPWLDPGSGPASRASPEVVARAQAGTSISPSSPLRFHALRTWIRRCSRSTSSTHKAVISPIRRPVPASTWTKSRTSGSK